MQGCLDIDVTRSSKSFAPKNMQVRQAIDVVTRESKKSLPIGLRRRLCILCKVFLIVLAQKFTSIFWFVSRKQDGSD